jgi:hypothetical protein
MRCPNSQSLSEALPYGKQLHPFIDVITCCILWDSSNVASRQRYCKGTSPGSNSFTQYRALLIFDLSRAYPRHLTSRQSYMGLTIRCVWRRASVVLEGLLCLRGHAVHHRGEYPPASWRVAVRQVIGNKYIANKQKCVRCAQHSNDHRRHRRTRLRHPYQYASPADDGHQGVPQ